MVEYREKKILMNKEEMAKTIKRLSNEIIDRNQGINDFAIIGIQTRGVYLAKRIINEITTSDKLEKKPHINFGILDINLYRDDVDTLESPPIVKETEIPFDINGKTILLVDDVIFTGRSIRAAMDEIMDFGRPKIIQLAVFVDRGHRELPIEPNFIGKKFQSSLDELISVELEEIDGIDRVVLKEIIKKEE